MKRHALTLGLALLLASAGAALAPQTASAYDLTRLLGAGGKILQASTITDEQLAAYVGQYVASLDRKNTVLPPSDPYSIRLDSICRGLTQVDGIPLNFKVYKTDDINAFACADGSVRVYSGLMDIMTDDQVLGVIGHEIGHVAHRDTKKAFRQALLNSALRDGLASTGGAMAALTDSQLGDLGEAMLSARYSRKQEAQADDYGYDFLRLNGKNPWAMAMAFIRMQQMENASPAAATWINTLLSDHPELDSRIENMTRRATRDGYTRPPEGTPGNAGSPYLHPATRPTAATSSASVAPSPSKKQGARTAGRKTSRRR